MLISRLWRGKGGGQTTIVRPSWVITRTCSVDDTRSKVSDTIALNILAVVVRMERGGFEWLESVTKDTDSHER